MAEHFTRRIGTTAAGPLLAAGIVLGTMVIGEIGSATAETTTTTPVGQRTGIQTSGMPGPATLLPHLGLAG